VVLVLWKHRNKVFLMSEKSLDAGRKLQISKFEWRYLIHHSGFGMLPYVNVS